MLNNQLVIADVDSIEHIEGVLYEKEDTRAKDFLRACGKDKRQRKERGASCNESRSGIWTEETN